jgi:CBS domain-containing protein
MTGEVRCVEPRADVSDVAHLFVEERLRSAPVVDEGRLVGIVSRRDLLRVLVRTDPDIRSDLLALVEHYTEERGVWEVTVAEGIATIRRTHGQSPDPPGVEERALTALARTVGGVVAVRVLPPPPAEAGGRSPLAVEERP